MTENQLSDFDNFFFFGEGNLLDEIQMEILSGIVQPKRTMFYNRQEGCGINEKENYPNSFILQIGIRYDIINFISYRNANVETGIDGGKERRVAVSQSFISFDKNEDRQTYGVLVNYIPLVDIGKPVRLAFPIVSSKGA